MIITHKELFDEYTKTEYKGSFLQKKAKELNVPRSSVICELLKSGYKFDEIKRTDANNYNAAMNKFNKWVEDGRPEVTFEVPEVVPVVEKKPYKKPVLITEEMALKLPTEDAERAVTENLSEKPEPVIVSQPEPVKEKPKSVVITSPKKKSDEMSPEDIAKLKFRICELENENKQAGDRIRELIDYKQKYEELLDQYDIATLDNETAQNAMAEEYRKRIETEQKLKKAERIICDRIYDDMADMVE